MRYDREHKAKTRDRILDVAARAIRASGPDKVAVAAVMSEAGLTHGGFYAHFPSKDALISAAVGRMFDDAATRNRLSGEAAGPALCGYVDAYLSRVHRDAPETGCPLPAQSDQILFNARAAVKAKAGLDPATRRP